MARMLTSKSFVALGHEVVGQAVDGLDGFAQYESLKPDLISTDLEMPNLNGMGLLQQVRAVDQDVHCIVISSVVKTNMVKRVESMNARMIAKPFNSKALAEVIESFS